VGLIFKALDGFTIRAEARLSATSFQQADLGPVDVGQAAEGLLRDAGSLALTAKILRVSLLGQQVNRRLRFGGRRGQRHNSSVADQAHRPSCPIPCISILSR
jgi:hypothetical protein